MRLGTTAVWAAAAAVALGMATTASAAEAGSPGAATSTADVQKLIDDGNFAGAVSAASRLTSTANNGGGADKAALFAAKGEAQLHLKQGPQAADSFDHAAKAAADPATVSQMTATALLARRSHNGTYTPKHAGADGAKPAAIDVVAADSRKTAMSALFDDELATDTPAITAAESSKSLPTLMKAIDTLMGLRAVEVAATGSDDKTKPHLATIGGAAHDLLATKLQTMGERVKVIGDAANREPRGYGRTAMGGGMSTPRKAGLSSSGTQELNGIIADCDKIGSAADAFAKATATPGATAADAAAGGGAANGPWDGVSSDARRIAGQAKDVLSADYGTGANGGNNGANNGTGGMGGSTTGSGVRRGGGVR